MNNLDKIEIVILKNIISNEIYVRKVLPFIKKEYFEDTNQKVIFDEIYKFIFQYNKPLTKEILCIEIEKREDITQDQYVEIINTVSYFNDELSEFSWLIDTTEKWCRDRAIYLALMESIHIADGKDEKKNRDSIPSILSDALAVSFDTHIGHDYLLDYEKRYESYHRKEEKIEFDLEYFNKITKGGLPNKTLNVALAGTGVGKSLFMCHVAAGHFKALLNELALKKSFRPDIIFIDYLNICSSSRYRGNSNINSYTFVKAIAEELRGLAVEFNVPIVSATQTTRSGYGNSDVELTDTSESFGLPATADLMFALISTEELEGLGQILVKQLKNRYNDPTIHKRFVIGIDRAKMRLYDCEQSAQDGIVDNGRDEEYDYEEPKPKKTFEGFKF